MKFSFTPAISIIEILFIRIPVIPDESFAAAVGSDAPLRKETGLFSLAESKNKHITECQQDQINLHLNTLNYMDRNY
jgi:hypothetical protein